MKEYPEDDARIDDVVVVVGVGLSTVNTQPPTSPLLLFFLRIDVISTHSINTDH